MGKVRYLVDGVEIGIFSLYNDYNINSTFITTVSGLTEGTHVLRAEAIGEKDPNATGTIIDCAKVMVYHLPYEVNDIVLAENSVTLVEGSQYQVNYTVVPDYAENNDFTYNSSDTNIATVSENGLIFAQAVGIETITLSSVKYNITRSMTVTVTLGNPQINRSKVPFREIQDTLELLYSQMERLS